MKRRKHSFHDFSTKHTPCAPFSVWYAHEFIWSYRHDISYIEWNTNIHDEWSDKEVRTSLILLQIFSNTHNSYRGHKTRAIFSHNNNASVFINFDNTKTFTTIKSRTRQAWKIQIAPYTIISKWENSFRNNY